MHVAGPTLRNLSLPRQEVPVCGELYHFIFDVSVCLQSKFLPRFVNQGLHKGSRSNAYTYNILII